MNKPVHILIDPREGSKKFIKLFEEDERDIVRLDGGDFAFTGNGPDDTTWLFGIEHKQISDLVACIQNNRFLGTQLPEMVKLYDVMFLVVEGYYKADPHTGRLVQSFGKGNGYSYGISFSAFDNYLTAVGTYSSLMGKPCIVKRTANIRESEQVIRDAYHYFQKPWDEHKIFGRPDFTKLQSISEDLEILRVEPGSENYPTKILRQSLLQIKGFSWRIAGLATDQFGTLEKALQATRKDWEQVDGVGRTLAERAYHALHGYDDPTAGQRKRKTKGG